MNILICDYEEACKTDYSLTVQSIHEVIADAQITIHRYEGKKDLYERIADADGLITAFLPLNEAFFNRAKRLKCVSVSAAGYGNIDLKAAYRAGVGICHIEEYCTQEVAEHTFSLIGALNRNLKYYNNQIEKKAQWQYGSIPGGNTLAGQTLAVFGFGKIGKRVAELAGAFGMRVLAVSTHLCQEEAQEHGVTKALPKEAFCQADVISCHMNLTEENYHYFDDAAFEKMQKKPLFINVGRGACVDENALVRALDAGRIRGAGLDVLEAENPVLAGHPLLNRDNVILTPHSAFYSCKSMERLQKISAKNLAYYLKGEREKVHSIVV